MTFALDLAELDFGLDALDAYTTYRRPAHRRAITIGKVLLEVHRTLKELAELGFGGDDDDFDF
jgi:hypothetical protein